MPLKLKIAVSILVASILALTLGITVAAQGKYGGTIIEALGTEPTNLDISKATRRPEATILDLISEPLLTTNENLEVEPLLAKSWEVSEDHLSWTFHLKEGINFHDGTPLNAEAVKFSLERHKDGSHGWMLGPLKEIKVVDNNTVVLKLDKPYPMLLNYLANYWLGIISPAKVQKYGEDYGVKAISGTGPFKFKEWISGDRIILVRNEDYQHGPSFASNQGPAYVEKWVFRFIPESSTLVAELEEGNVDISDYIPEDALTEVKEHPNTNVATKTAPSTIHIVINLGYKKKGGTPQNSPYDDVRVREAIAHAINKEAVIKAALFGAASPAYTLTPPNVKWYWQKAKELGKKYTSYNPEKSRNLLNKAGWIDTDGDGIREKEGKELKATLFAFTITRYKRIAEVVQPMLTAVGFKVELLTLEAGDLYERVERGEHDLLSTAWMGWSFPQDGLVPMVHSKNLGTSTNWFLYSNPEVDRLLDKSLTAVDKQERVKALNKVQKIIIEDVIAVPLAYPLDIFGYKKTVGGVDKYMEHPWAFSQMDALRALELYKKS